MKDSLPEIPSNVFVTHLACNRKDAQLVAEDWIQDQGRKQGWYWIHRLGDGYLVEAHIDGPGKSFLSSIIDSERQDGIIPSVRNDLVVEINRTSIHTLVIDHDEAFLAKPDYLHGHQAMKRVLLDPSSYLLTSAVIAFLISVAGLTIALSARPPIDPIQIPDQPIHQTPSQWWDTFAHWGREESPLRLTFNESEKWNLITLGEKKAKGASE